MPALDNAVVRILHANGSSGHPVGGGFLALPRHVLTCAHVVADALGLAHTCLEKPDENVYLDFPLLPQHTPLLAAILKWYPVKQSPTTDELSDIALLELSSELPQEAQAVRLSLFDNSHGHAVHLFGFPQNMPDGYRLGGMLQGKVANGQIQINTESGREKVAGGFSGTPVWDAQNQAIAGIVVSIHQRNLDTPAYMIPAQLLQQVLAAAEQHTATQARKIFISYSHAIPVEKALADCLHAQLTEQGLETFIDSGIQTGTNWVREIHARIEWCEAFIVLLSSAGQDSEMVQYEVRLAWQRNQSKGLPMILPVRLNDFDVLDYELDKYLGELQYLPWQGPADNRHVLQNITAVLQNATDQSPSPSQNLLPRQTSPLRPQVTIDPRGLIVPGGTTRPSDNYYLKRHADNVVSDLAAHSNETLVIKAPRQMGKSSLLVRYLLACREAGKQIAFIDLSQFSDRDMEEYPVFLTRIAQAFQRALRLEVEQPRIETQQNLIWWMEDQVVGGINAPLTIAFDETDRVFGREYQADFFTMLRHWHNARADIFGTWENTDLALSISTEPYLLINEADRSPFNVGLTQELNCFSLNECRVLNEKYHDFLSDTQVVQLWDLLGGHPYLTRLAYYRLLASNKIAFAELLNSADDERGPFGEHLRALFAKLYQYHELLRAFRTAIRTGKIDNPDHYYRLYGAGLVRRESGRINPANLLYARFFKGML